MVETPKEYDTLPAGRGMAWLTHSLQLLGRDISRLLLLGRCLVRRLPRLLELRRIRRTSTYCARHLAVRLRWLDLLLLLLLRGNGRIRWVTPLRLHLRCLIRRRHLLRRSCRLRIRLHREQLLNALSLLHWSWRFRLRRRRLL